MSSVNTYVRSYTGFVPTAAHLAHSRSTAAAALGLPPQLETTPAPSLTAATALDTLAERDLDTAHRRPYLAASLTVNATQVHGYTSSYTAAHTAAGSAARAAAGRAPEPQDVLTRPWLAAVSGYAGHIPHVEPTSVSYTPMAPTS